MQPPRPTARNRRSILSAAVAAGVAATGWWYWRTSWSLGVLALAAVALVLAAVFPRTWAPVQAALDRLTRLLVTAVTLLLLGAVFLLVFVPGRLVLALRRHDPLQRAPDPGRASYWEPLPPAAGPARFRRPF